MRESPEPEQYRLGDLFIDVPAGTVTRNAEVLALPPRTFDLLLALARRYPRRVRRRDLLDTLWPGEVVSDQTLSHRVLLLRRALADDSARPRYVAADRGWGYHLLLPAERLTEGSIAGRTGRPSLRGRSRRLSLALALTALALAAGAVLPRGRSPVAPASAGLRVEVDPIRCESARVADEFVARRLTDRIASALASDPDLRVVVDGGHAGGERPDARASGSLSARGETLDVRLVVTAVRSGRAPWEDGFQGPVYEVFAAEDHLASRVTSGVRRALGLPVRSPEDLAVADEVSRLCLRGEWMTRSWQGGRLRQAASLFERAIRLDETSGRAHAGLATAHVALALLGEEPTPAAARVARPAAEGAVRLAPDLPDARVARGLVRLVLDWELPGAERELALALRHTKRDPLPLLAYALFLQAAGQPDASLPLLRLAREADPDAAVVPLLSGHAHYLAGRCDRALEDFEGALILDPYLAPARSLAGACYSDLGQEVLALDALRRVRGLAAAPASSLASLERAHVRAGLAGVWGQVCDEPPVPGLAPVRAAAACARAGRTADALRWLDRAANRRAPGLLFVRWDPAFDPIRGTSGFREVLSKSGLPEPSAVRPR